MSEYQYYEFRAVDKPLDQRALAHLRELSSRAEISPTSFINTYNWGDFRGDPQRLMEQYFDAFVYVANWGTHQFMVRVPAKVLDLATAKHYALEDAVDVRQKGAFVLLDLVSREEAGGDWEQGEDWLDALIPLRDDLLGGDLRCLYLAWLAGVQFYDEDDDQVEPPLPPGMRRLTTPLQRLADFLRVDPSLIEAAAAADTGEAPSGPSPDEQTAWVAALPEGDKNAVLLDLLQGDAGEGPLELRRRFRADWASQRAGSRSGTATSPRRTVGDLIRTRNALKEARRRREAAKAAREEARRAREKAEARVNYLDSLARREAEVWREVELALETKRPKEYDRAVQLLKDLRELAERTGQTDEVAARIAQLRERHRNKPSLIARFRKAGLPG